MDASGKPAPVPAPEARLLEFGPSVASSSLHCCSTASLEVARTILGADVAVLTAAVAGWSAPGAWGVAGAAAYTGAAARFEIGKPFHQVRDVARFFSMRKGSAAGNSGLLREIHGQIKRATSRQDCSQS